MKLLGLILFIYSGITAFLSDDADFKLILCVGFITLLLENTFDQKRISANPNSNSNPNPNDTAQ